MASVRKEIAIAAPAATVWAALADFHAVHKRLAPGFVTDSKPDGEAARIVTFANGTSAREILVDSNATLMRLVYAIARSERLKHHNASAQVVALSPKTCCFIWVTDFLPDEIGPYIDAQMSQGAEVMKRTLEGT